MAGASGGRSLEQTPTWAVAVVCFVLVTISIIIEYIIHLIGKWLRKKHKRAQYEALEKIKSELMLLGFISLLLTVCGNLISKICIPASVAKTWHPCSKEEEEELTNNNINGTEETTEYENRRRLLAAVASSGGSFRRALAAASTTDKCAAKGKVPFVSEDGIHQLHIFIFVLAVFHVLYCVLTMALGRAKMKTCKKWEKETRTIEYQFSHDPERFRFARETSFGRRHLSFWTKTPVLIWIVCFFRQFFRSVTKVDYLTLRHGFIMAHLAPQSQSQFNFQKYINRSLEEDFKVVVGISPPIWFFAVVFLLFNIHGWYTYLWLPFIPLIVILLVGTKLQVIITKMGIKIQERGEVVKGVPVVQPGDDLFWFNKPRLILYLINFVLFQNAFQLAFFAWSWYEFGIKSCFHEHTEDIVIRITMGVLIQILCSYVTLPLYALVTQMGSNMKPTIFNERVALALRNWHHTAKKHIKQNKGYLTPLSSRPSTPSHNMSPLHLLRHKRSEMDSLNTSPRRSLERWDTDSPSSSHNIEKGYYKEYNKDNIVNEPGSSQQYEIQIVTTKDFSFDKRMTLIPALRTVGNIVTGDDMQTQCIINHQALPCLLDLLTKNYKKSIKKEACWTISNISAGNVNQIQAIIEAGIIGPLVDLLLNAEFEIKKEAAWAISNATSGGTNEQIKFLVSQGCIKPLCDLLNCPDPRIVTVCLEGLENILKVGEAEKNMGNTGVNIFAQAIDDAEGLEKIENLQSHDNNEIYEKAVKILETYWVEEDEDETLPPGDATQAGFGFAGNKLPVPSGGFNFS